MQRRGRGLMPMAVSLLLLHGVTARAAEEVIDAFSDASAATLFVSNMNVVESSLGSTVRVDSGLSGVIGGVRQLTVAATVLDTGSDAINSGVSIMPPTLVFDSTFGADGRVEILYDANGAGLNANLEFAQGIQVVFLTGDASATVAPGMDVTLTLIDDNMTPVQVTQNFLGMQIYPLTVTFPFSSFAGIDASKLLSIELVVDPQQSADLVLGPLQTFGTPTDETICDDGIDNNNNGFTDCADQDCVTFPGCAEQAPALSPQGIALASAALSLIGLAGIGRLRRRSRA